LVRASPQGPVREGQVLDFRTRELGVAFRVRMDIGKPEPPLLLTLRVHMPFGIVNDEHISWRRSIPFTPASRWIETSSSRPGGRDDSSSSWWGVN